MIGSGAWTLRSDSVTSPSKAAPRQSGQQARGRSRSALLAKRNQRVSGSCSFWNAGSTGRSRMYQQMPEQQEGAAPASSESATRIRIRPHPLRSPSTTRLRLHRRLRARTGAVQVDAGVAGAIRSPALGAPGRTGEDAATRHALGGGRGNAAEPRPAYIASGLSGRSSRRTRIAMTVTMSASTVAPAPMVSAVVTPLDSA